MSATNDSNDRVELAQNFVDVCGKWSDKPISIAPGVTGKANILAIIFDWDEWVDHADHDFIFDRDDFDQNPGGVTCRYLGDDDPTAVTIFSQEDGCSYYTGQYMEKAEEVLGYNPRANLDKVWMLDEETRPIIFEGDEFDLLLAPRVKPGETR